MKKIYLFRHSNPDKTSTLQNEYIPLSQEGKDLAKQLVDKLPVTSPIKVFSSPFIRAKQTADTFSFDVITDARLIERKVGNKNTFTKDLWAKQYTDIDAKNDSGESSALPQSLQRSSSRHRHWNKSPLSSNQREHSYLTERNRNL